MRKETKFHFDNILDTMTGADGAGKFAEFMFALRGIDEQADKGDEKSEEIIQIMIRFSRLIDALQRKS